MMTDPGRYAVTERGRRLHEHVLMAQALGGRGRWIAARLSDGSTDGHIYDTKADAVRHQLHETQCAYLVVPQGPMPVAEATAWLELHENMYRAGYRLQDPDLSPMMTSEHQQFLNRSGRRRALREATRAGRRL